MIFSTDAVVIREKKLEEHDRLLTLLTKDKGIVTVYGRGASKLKGSMVSSTEFLCYSHFQIFSNKEKSYLDNAESNKVFFGIRSDIAKLSLATYFCQMAMELVQPYETDQGYLRLMLNSLHFLEEGDIPNIVLKCIFELRILSMSGYMPDLIACTACGTCDSQLYFSPIGGNLFCSHCKPATLTDGIAVNSGVLSAMRHIIYSDFKKIFNFTINEKSQKDLAYICRAYTIGQVEKVLPALKYYENISKLS